MPETSFDTLIQSEKAHMESLYDKLEHDISDAKDSENSSRNYVLSNKYEDQDAFTAHGDFSKKKENRAETESLYNVLFRKPYFAHIELQDDDDAETRHYFLSDCTSLNEPYYFGENGENLVIPFKKDNERPISDALIKCYYKNNSEPELYTVNTNAGPEIHKVHTKFICNDTIKFRELKSAVQLFPAVNVDADELLAAKLDENRNNTEMQNIIATLQQEQFRIIQKNLTENFVVQGCAGSGKSQCIFHRLFYMRKELSDDGWSNVLLLTPTKLFKNHSADLIQKFQLLGINNCSIAELYKEILSSFDSRFKDRQYRFELSEEYLPDSYLKIVYNDTMITKVEEEIDSSIKQYIKQACDSLKIDMVEPINNETVANLIIKLDEEITASKKRESLLATDSEYEERSNTYAKQQKALESYENKLEKFKSERAESEKSLKELNELIKSAASAKSALNIYAHERKKKYTSAKKLLSDAEKAFGNNYTPDVPLKYARRLSAMRDITAGEEYSKDEETIISLENNLAETEKSILVFLNGETQKSLLTAYQEKSNTVTRSSDSISSSYLLLTAYQTKSKTLTDKIMDASVNIEKIKISLQEYENWLKSKSSELGGYEASTTVSSSELERVRRNLSGIANIIFEQVIWNTLTPYKEENNINSLDVTLMSDGHRKETRILYKSDLLFYIKIYMKIYSNDKLQQYKYLCIDEGQDLHKADYDILRAMFPNAVFNIFGDTAQALHTECGVSNWESATGISQIYTLTRNYRNTASIVDFCNRNFKSGMEFVGAVREDNYPLVIKNAKILREYVLNEASVIIVRDFQSYREFCLDSGFDADRFEFLDTHAEKPSGEKIACYSIFAAKGLEFPSVLVYARNMTLNQKAVACTRAMEKLYYYE